jgi:hypothetical protein
MRLVSKLTKKARGSEWGVVRRYNICEKPSDLSWLVLLLPFTSSPFVSCFLFINYILYLLHFN